MCYCIIVILYNLCIFNLRKTEHWREGGRSRGKKIVWGRGGKLESGREEDMEEDEKEEKKKKKYKKRIRKGGR